MNKPRNQCGIYFVDRGIGNPIMVSKVEFDKHYSEDEFSDGPFGETFGDGRLEPYNPSRQAFGILKNGRGIFCELSDVVDNTDEVKADEAVTESQ